MSEQHLSVDALADLLAGDGDRASVDHLSGCAACSGRLADLEAALVPVAAELAALAASPLPAPPADLEERLLARLRQEGAPALPPAAPGRSAADDVVPAAVPAGAVPLRPRAGGRPRGAGLLGAAAGAVGLLAVVGLGLGLALSGTGSSDSSSESAAGGATAAVAPPADIPTSATGNDYRPDSASFAAALPALLDPGTPDPGTPDSGTPDPGRLDGGTARLEDAPAAAAAPEAAQGQAGDASGTGGSAGAGAPAAAPAADPLARLRDPAELAGCLSALTGPETDGVPLALDYAAFEGRPALVVVLPSAREDAVDVFTVGAGCRAGADDTLFFTRLPRP